TDNSWGPRAIGDHGAPVSLPKLKKAYEKGTRGISWGPLLTPGPRAVPEFPNGQESLNSLNQYFSTFLQSRHPLKLWIISRHPNLAKCGLHQTYYYFFQWH
ncbi:unnamed protein product, partial [Staurois parvus]